VSISKECEIKLMAELYRKGKTIMILFLRKNL